MALLDRLLPAWRHRDPDVRAAAVRKLDQDSADVLATVARSDSDVRVRRIAIKKLDDPDALLEIGRSDADEELRTLATARAEDLFVTRATSDRPIEDCLGALSAVTRPGNRVAIAIRAVHADVRRTALESIGDERSLADVARRGDDPDIGLAALPRITDGSLLQRIAAREGSTAVALAALGRLDDADLLQALADDPRAQKSVRKQARVRLAAILGDDHPMRAAARRERQTQLCVSVERLMDTSDPATALVTLRAAEHEWQELSVHAAGDVSLAERFRHACATAHESITRAEQYRDADERRASARRQDLATRQQLCDTVDALQGAEIPGALSAARAAWQALAYVDDPQIRDFSTRFSLAVERCEQRYERWRMRDAFRSQLEALVHEAERLVESHDPRAAARPRAALERRWHQLTSSPAGIKWLPDERALEHRFTEAGEALPKQEQAMHSERQQRARAARVHLEALCHRLEQLSQHDKVTPAAADRATAAAADIDAQLRALPAADRDIVRQRLTAARQAVARRVDAVVVAEDWKQWANAEVQQQLIAQAEALLASNDPDRMLREGARLDEEWKRAAAAPRPQAQALWARFRDARRELRRRADAYLSENQAKKEALCQAVEALAESTDWNASVAAIRRMQEEWKQIGPVRRHMSATLFARFRTPANRFFERHKQHRLARKEEYEERLGRMRTLCEAAETLADSTDWDSAAAEIKRLQRSAQDIWGRRPAPAPRQVGGPIVGPARVGDVPTDTRSQPRQTDALRQRFELACNGFFDRYRRRDSLELETKLAALESVLADLNSLRLALAGPDAATVDVAAQLTERLAEWGRIGPVPPERARVLNQRLQAACDAIEALHADGFADGALDGGSNLPQREKLCVRLERLAAALITDRDQPSNLAERLKLALAANTIGGPALPPHEQLRQDTYEAAARLREKWQRLGPVIGPRARALAQRFAQADARIMELCGQRVTAPEQPLREG